MLSAEYKMLTEVDATSNRTWKCDLYDKRGKDLDSVYPIIPAWKYKPALEGTKYLIKCLHAESCETEHSSSLMLGEPVLWFIIPQKIFKVE